MRITLNEFLAALPALGPWQVSSIGAIQQQNLPRYCPWLAVREAQADYIVWRGGLNVNAQIWIAADNRPDHDPELRRLLLAACGLAKVT